MNHTVGIHVDSGDSVRIEATLWGSGTWANLADKGGSGSLISGTINMRAVPSFVNPAAKDYHIGAGSAAIDAGVDTGVSVDIDGDVRPLDGDGDDTPEYDIGADEWVASPSSYRVYVPFASKQTL